MRLLKTPTSEKRETGRSGKLENGGWQKKPQRKKADRDTSWLERFRSMACWAMTSPVAKRTAAVADCVINGLLRRRLLELIENQYKGEQETDLKERNKLAIEGC